MLFDLATVLVFLVFSFGFLFATLMIGKAARVKHPDPRKEDSYECGHLPIGSGYVQFNIRFYIVALIFIIFDVEIALLFPWVALLRDPAISRTFWFVEIMIFAAVLVAGLVYVWRKGDLEWVRTTQHPGTPWTHPIDTEAGETKVRRAPEENAM